MRHTKDAVRTFDATLEDLEIEVSDGLWVSTAECEVECKYEGYDPGYRYNRNGDGCPPSGGYAYVVSVSVKWVELENDEGENLAVKCDHQSICKKVAEEIEKMGKPGDEWATEQFAALLDD